MRTRDGDGWGAGWDAVTDLRRLRTSVRSSAQLALVSWQGLPTLG